MKHQRPLIDLFFKSLLVVLFGLVISFNTLAQENSFACGTLKNHYGPFDYRTDRGEKLDVVNRAHFTPQIEALIRGHTDSIGGDLSYTLRTFPNHHRALLTMMRYGQKLKTPQPKDMEFSVDCYFQRALLFRPDDTVARLMYANFLTTNGRNTEAMQHIGQVGVRAGDNAFTHYNMGLSYLELKEYEKALEQAHIAMALGLELPALREKLTAAGQWREPAPQATPAQTNPVSQ